MEAPVPEKPTAARSSELAHRIRYLTIASLAAIFSAGIAVYRFMVEYREAGAWQILSLAVAFGIAIILGLVALLLIRDRKLDAAAFIIILHFAGTFLAYNALVTISPWMVLGLGLLVIFVMTFFTLRNRLWLGLLVAALFTAFVSGFIPLANIQRFNPVERQYMGIILPINTAFLVGVILIQAAYLRWFRNTIFNRLLVSITTLVLVTIVSVTGFSASIQLENRREDTLDRLQTVTSSKISAIDSWLNLLSATLDTIQANDLVSERSISFLETGSPAVSTTNASPERIYLANQLSRYLGTPPPLFEAIYLINLKGEVFASTGDVSHDQAVITTFWEYVKEGANRQYFSPLILDQANPALPTPTLFIAQPVFSRDGKTAGVLAGRANNFRLLQILSERTGLGLTGEAYLVGSNRTMLTSIRQPGAQAGIGVRLNTTNAVASQTELTGQGSYTNYNGVPVFGVFRRVSRLDAALIADQEQREALEPVDATIRSSIMVGLVALIIALLVAIFVTRTITAPVGALARAANQIASGDLNIRAQLQRDDEIGMLGNSFNIMADQLDAQVKTLEQRVADRTAELRERAIHIKVAGEIARDVATASDQSEVMNRAVNLIRERFGFYHAGIFLVDEHNEYAVLRSAAGEAGLAMLERGHRLKIGETGIVGFVVARGIPRIALDVGADAVYFKNPFLPRTRSEMALPLKVTNTSVGQTGAAPSSGNEFTIIGALDVQSIEPNAFDDDDIQILQTLADQLAVAIQKTILLQQFQSSVNELEATYRQYTGKAWRDYLAETRQGIGFRYRQFKVEPISQQMPEAQEALIQKRSILSVTKTRNNGQEDAASLAVPIELRGQSLGVLNLKFVTESVSPETISLVEGLTNRLALALENARLLEQIQRQAERDRQVGQIAAKVRASTNVDHILRTAVEELGRSLGVSQAVIQLYTDQQQGSEEDIPGTSHLSPSSHHGTSGNGQSKEAS